VLVVLDPTTNPKLQDLISAFERENGDIYVGADAWAHLESAAGKTMALFLDKYVRDPIQWVLKECPELLPDLTLAMSEETFIVSISGEKYSFPRAEIEEMAGETPLPEDVDDETPGP
jgi:hypothetical protein